MTIPTLPALLAGLILLSLTACTANRPVAVSPEPAALAAYLQQEHPRDIQVTNTAGGSVWLHNPRLSGDSLTGELRREEPREQRAIPVGTIRTIAQPHFSAGRTVGFLGGVLGSAGVALLIVATNGAEPAY
jgi:hypothetical protein